MVCAFDENAAKELRVKLADTDIEVLTGMDGLIACASESGADIVVTAVEGMVGLLPTLAAIDAGRTSHSRTRKRSCARAASSWRRRGKKGVRIPAGRLRAFGDLSVCAGRERKPGLEDPAHGFWRPVLREKVREMRGMTREQALAHPNWSMGAKITIDSATMMNKGLELIEAMWLYDLPPEDIEIVVHRESIVHSAVEFADGAVIAQRSACRICACPFSSRDLAGARAVQKCRACRSQRSRKLTFFAPDYEAFPALNLAKAGRRPQGRPRRGAKRCK